MIRLLSLVPLWLATSAMAETGQPDTYDDLVNDEMAAAQGAFVGTVIAIEYRESDPATYGETYPHTYVTWRVDHAFKGVRDRDTLTARFIGGPTSDGRRTLVVSELPLFDVGDHDIVFVADNGVSGCPLDRCAAGRMRVVDGLVYTDDGQGVAITDETLTLTAPADLAAIRENTIGGRVFRTSGDRGPSTEGAPRPASEADVVALLDQVARQYPATAPAPSVSTRTPFVVEMRP